MKIYNYLFFLMLIFGLSLDVQGQKRYTVDEIPDPKQQGQDYFISDPDGILADPGALNHLIAELERKTKVEIAVVVVNDFDENLDEFEFALQLFRKWGLGKKGADNGLLLFASIDRRKYYMVTGYGLEGMLPDLKLRRMAERYLVPSFKEQHYDEGISKVLNVVAADLGGELNEEEIAYLNSKETSVSSNWLPVVGYSSLAILLFVIAFRILGKYTPVLTKENKKKRNAQDRSMAVGCIVFFFVCFIGIFVVVFIGADFKKEFVPVILAIVLSFVLYFNYQNSVSSIRKLHQDDENFLNAAKAFNRKVSWMAALSPLMLFGIIGNHRKRNQLARERFVPPLDSRQQPMVRLDRDQNKDGEPYLTKGQRNEEISQVYDYDIWVSQDGKEHQLKVWPAETYSDYSECPTCLFRTYSKPIQKTISAATYTRSGKAEVVRECKNCKHSEFIRAVVLAQLVKSTSSGSGSSSGGSSSSSSSGSWGGGSSGGGGSGGSW